MRFRTSGLLLLGAMALPASGTAQTTPAPPAITRTLVAATKLPTVADPPLYFRVVSVTLQPDEKSEILSVNGIVYQMSGSTEISLDGEAKTLNAGGGCLFPAERRRRSRRVAAACQLCSLLHSFRCGPGPASRNGPRRGKRAISHRVSNRRPATGWL